MADETLKIYVWPDNSWESAEEIDDMDWYLSSMGKSDDYAEYEVDINLDAEDITELIELEALPGMIPPKSDNPLDEGEIVPLDPGSILVINVPPGDDAATYITRMRGQIIINAASISIKVLKGK